MATMSEHHHIDTPLGEGKCSKPMWFGHGGPAGFCDKPAYGPATEIGKRRTTRYEMGQPVGSPSAPALACRLHAGPTLQEAIADRTVIRFDGPPSHDAGRFIEVERNGKSINAGDWVQDGDDWLLVMQPANAVN